MARVQPQKTDHSLESLFRDNSEQGDPNSPFEMVGPRTLRFDVQRNVWINKGAVIAHYGDVTFEQMHILKAKNIKGMALRELARFVKAKGDGQVYCAHHGWHLRTVRLSRQTLNISSSELLAFEGSLEFEPFLIGKGISLASRGVIAVKLSGEGWLAIAVHGDPLVLPVSPERPLNTDPNATVAWTENLQTTLRTDVTGRTLIGHGGGEAFQMRFSGTGHVVVQPSEDAARFPGKKLKSLL